MHKPAKHKLGVFLYIAAAGLLLSGHPAVHAESLVISNSSFETPSVSPGNFSAASAPPGWSAYGNITFNWRTIGVVNPNSTQLYLDPVPLGSNVGVVFLGPTYSNSPAGMQQTISTTLQGRTTYILRVAIGNMNNDPTPPHNSFNFAGFPGYRVELLAGGYVVASDQNSLLPGEGRFVTSTVQVATLSTHTNIGLPLGIRLLNLDAAPGIEVNFDNVRLDTSPSPDPQISIIDATNGNIRIQFTENVQASSDFVNWTNVNPQPFSPWIPDSTGDFELYRATE
jgi:hypothetical protein